MLLESTKQKIREQLSSESNPSSLGGPEFEDFVFRTMLDESKGSMFEGKIVHTKDRAFPDIVAAGLLGVEVKATQKDGWTSLGNSVLESSREDGLEKIFIFFGKLGGKPEIKFRKYEECLQDIRVTHYPRYLINMNLKTEDSILHKMGVSYAEISRSKNPVSYIRDNYKHNAKDGQRLWWLDDESENVPALSPVIKNFSDLPLDEKKKMQTEVIIRFPAVFSPSAKDKYKDVAAFLVSQYGVVSASLRDEFSAGGQARVGLGEKTLTLPHIVGETIKNLNEIKRRLQEDGTDLDDWLNLVDIEASGHKLEVPLSEILLEGKFISFKKDA